MQEQVHDCSLALRAMPPRQLGVARLSEVYRSSRWEEGSGLRLIASTSQPKRPQSLRPEHKSPSPPKSENTTREQEPRAPPKSNTLRGSSHTGPGEVTASIPGRCRRRPVLMQRRLPTLPWPSATRWTSRTAPGPRRAGRWYSPEGTKRLPES